MALESADKIFIDVDEEINFVIEKVINSPKSRVILVAPQNATLLSSLVSIKILVNRVIKSNKLVILVTEDKFGLRLAARAGLVALEKVSNVTPDQWEAAQIKKQNLSDQYNNKKQELLAARDETMGDSLPAVSLIVPKVVSEELVDIMQPQDQIEEEAQDLEQDADEEALEPEILPIQRVRRQPKLIQAGSFTLLAGGDILTTKQAERANIDSSMQKDEEPASKPVNAFTGKDWTYATRKAEPKSFWSRFTGNKENLSRTSLGVQVPINKRFYKSPIFWVIVAVIFGSGVGFVYILVNNLASVDIRLNMKTLQVPVEGQITALTTIQQADSTKLTIPAKIVTQNVNGSDSGTASGSSERGQKAGGLIEIWNKKLGTPVTLPVGTVIVNPQNGLNYILKEAVTVAAADLSTAIPQQSKSAQVRVEAKEFGPTYNYAPVSGDSNFKVGDYNILDLNAFILTSITGGSSEKFTSVSEEDISGVQNKVQERLLKQGVDKIKASLDSSFTILAGTEEIKVLKSSSVPAKGEQGSKLDLSIEAEVTILVVSKSDLQNAVSELVKRGNNNQLELVVDSSSPESLAKITKIDGGVTFTISADSNLKYQIDTSKVSSELGGKLIKDATEYVNSLSGVERASLLYTPDFIPDFLRIVPHNAAQIKITVN